MLSIEEICFQIICSAGEARSLYVEAARAAKRGKLEEAEERLKAGKDLLVNSHKIHFDLIAEEAGGNKTEVCLLLVHAEDLMMSAETLGIVAELAIDERRLLAEMREKA